MYIIELFMEWVGVLLERSEHNTFLSLKHEAKKKNNNEEIFTEKHQKHNWRGAIEKMKFNKSNNKKNEETR